MMNPTKFGSPHLDVYNSTYEFLKHTFKSMKTITNPRHTVTNRWGPLVSRTHASAIQKQRRCSGQPYLAGDEITGDDGDTIMFPTPSRVGWWGRRDLGFTGDSSLAAMADGRGSAAVCQRSPAITSSSEVRYDFVES